MKLPLTDKFLLDLYELINKTDKNIEPFIWLPSIKKFFYNDYYEIKNELKRKKNERKFSRFVYYLKKNGYIKIKNLETKKAIMLTSKGSEKVLKIKFKLSGKRKRKDGKWQMIIFDIPEIKRHMRDLLRWNLCFLGYKKLQQSVWICPYDVLRETEDILRKFDLDQYVRLFLIEEM